MMSISSSSFGKISIGKYIGLAGILVFVLIGLMTFGWVNVHPTEVAVEINKVAGKVTETPKGVGYHFFNRWITDMVIYKVAARAFPAEQLGETSRRLYQLDVKTKDGQNIILDLTVLYALKPNEVPSLHQQVGINYEDQIILPQIRSEARLAIGAYAAEEIYQGKVRDEIQQEVKRKLSLALEKYPAIQINDTLIRNFSFSAEFEKAIEQKKLAAQAVEINKNRALAQEEEAKRQEAEARGRKLMAVQDAEGRGQSLIAEAEGNASAKKINADAERYRLEQEAAGNLAIYKAEAEGKRLLAEALGGGQNVVAFKFAENIPDKLQIWGVPTGQNNTSIMDISGVFGTMFKKE